MACRQDIDRFMHNARVRLPGATDAPIQLEMFSMLDEFFRDTNVWLEDIDILVPGMEPAGTVYYAIPSTPSVVDKLMWVFTAPTDPNTFRGSAVAASMPVPGELVLGTQPSSDVTLRVTVALTVQDPVQKDGFVSFPEWVLAKYRVVLLDGLLGKMMSQPNKPFTNAQLSVYHMRRFNSGKGQARVDVARGNTFRRQAWSFPGMVRGSQHGYIRSGGGFGNPQ